MNATPGNNNSSRKTKKDAFQQPNLENSSPANPPKYPPTSPRKERILLTSFNQAFESPPYDDQPLLPQGRQAKGGDIQIKETYHKDGKGLPPQEQATFLPKSEAKGRGASILQNTSCLSKTPQPGSLE